MSEEMDSKSLNDDSQLYNENSETDEPVLLPLGDSLKSKDIYSISAIEPTILALLAGSTGSGKTTLITSIYQYFLRNPLNDYYFAGSRTLQAFEERSYLTRITSKQSVPEMQRTVRGSLDTILHLRLWSSVQDQYKNLLLTDFSGEDYKDILANTDLAKEEFGIVKMAKSIIVLMDGEKISNKTHKHAEVQNSICILRTFYDAGLIRKNTNIIVAISKFDLLRKQLDVDSILKAFIQNIPNKISNQLGYSKLNIKFMNIAAMPDDMESTLIKDDLEEIFGSIIDSSSEKSPSCYSDNSPTTTEFNLFSERVLK